MSYAFIKLLRSLMNGSELVNNQVEATNIEININVSLFDLSLVSFSVFDIGFDIYIIAFFALKFLAFFSFIKKSRKQKILRRRNKRAPPIARRAPTRGERGEL